MSTLSNHDFHINTRFSVFIIWSILFFIFFIVPLLLIYLDHLLRKLCRFLGCDCCVGRGRVDEDTGEEEPTSPGRYYSFMTGSQKREIQRLRNEIIKKCLDRYSVWLMVGQNTVVLKDGKGDDDLEKGVASVKDAGSSTEDKNTQSMQSENTKLDLNAFEMYIEDEENLQFTHVSIPHPGFDKNGNHVTSLSCIKKKKNQANKGFRFIYNLWPSKTNKPEQSQHQSTPIVQLQEKRTAPKFCAICLASYEPHDKISWSSNEACTHVFHNECILIWLSTLGKKWSRSQQFSANPELKELLGYSLECKFGFHTLYFYLVSMLTKLVITLRSVLQTRICE